MNQEYTEYNYAFNCSDRFRSVSNNQQSLDNNNNYENTINLNYLYQVQSSPPPLPALPPSSSVFSQNRLGEDDEAYFQELSSQYCKLYDMSIDRYSTESSRYCCNGSTYSTYFSQTMNVSSAYSYSSYSDDSITDLHAVTPILISFTKAQIEESPRPSSTLQSEQEYKPCFTELTNLNDKKIGLNSKLQGIKCQICNDVAKGFHYGVYSCIGCRIFFTRMRKRRFNGGKIVKCASMNCQISPTNRSSCPDCRFQKCLALGMSRAHSRLGRNSQPHTSPTLVHHRAFDELNASLGHLFDERLYAAEPSMNVDQLRDLYQQCIGLVQPQCDLAKYKFLIAPASYSCLINLIELFRNLFVTATVAKEGEDECIEWASSKSDDENNEGYDSQDEEDFYVSNKAMLCKKLQIYLGNGTNSSELAALKRVCFLTVMTKAITKDRLDSETIMLKIKLQEMIKIQLNNLGKLDKLTAVIYWIIKAVDSLG